MRKISNLILILILSIVVNIQKVSAQQFASGADVSWLTEMESAGIKFYSTDGIQTECMSLLQSYGMNAVRLRVWVNPANNWCNAADVLVKARRASDLGMRIMINFHYSDSWADPGKQFKPAAWAKLDLNGLKTAVANHTKEVLTLLKNNNITPEWVQVGNETGNGMLWETGKASVSMANYAALTNAGYDAVKEIFPSAKVIVHIHNGYDNGLFRWIFDGLKNNGGKWDVIGMSLYPGWYTIKNDWAAANKACLANMNDMVSRYNKEVMIVECGMSWDMAGACKNFLTDLITKTKSVSNGKGLGVFYWEPQAYGKWNGYTLGAFDYSGNPTVALDAFKNSTGIQTQPENGLKILYSKATESIKFSETLKSVSIINSEGKIILIHENTNNLSTQQLSAGIYVVKAATHSGEKLNRKIVIY